MTCEMRIGSQWSRKRVDALIELVEGGVVVPIGA